MAGSSARSGVLCACDTTHSYVWHDSFLCVTLCDVTDSSAGSGVLCACDMTHSYVWHDSFARLARLIRICYTTHFYAWHRIDTAHSWHDSFVPWLDLFGRVTWFSHKCDRTHLNAWHNLFVGMTRIVCTRDMSESYMWNYAKSRQPIGRVNNLSHAHLPFTHTTQTCHAWLHWYVNSHIYSYRMQTIRHELAYTLTHAPSIALTLEAQTCHACKWFVTNLRISMSRTRCTPDMSELYVWVKWKVRAWESISLDKYFFFHFRSLSTFVVFPLSLSYVWHNSSVYVARLVFYKSHGSAVCVTRLICVCDTTYVYIWHDSFVCERRLVRMCDTTNCISDTTYLYAWHDSLALSDSM